MIEENALRGRARWLVNFATLGQVTVAACAAQYAYFTVDLPRPAVTPCLLLLGTSVALAAVASEWLSSRFLRNFRAVCLGHRTDAEALVGALGEVRRYAQKVAAMSVAGWVAVTTVVAGGLVLGGWVSASETRHFALVCFWFAPTAAIVSSQLVNERASVVGEVLASGLPLAAAISALPRVRVGVRGRLLWLGGGLVVMQAGMLADAGQRLVAALTAAAAAVPALERASVLSTGQIAIALKLVWIALCSVLVVSWAAHAGSTVVAEPLRRLAADATRIARGELGRVVLMPAEGEAWRVIRVFARLKERLVELVGQLHGAGRQVSEVARTLHETTHRYEGGATEQAAALNQTSATTEELAHSARQIAANASSVLEIAQRTLEAAEAGQDDAQAFQASVERMRQDNQSIASAVDRLAQRVQQIGRIVEFINNVADRSDLLALSAELEGTRAGDVGRGFALVSAEMRRLAESVLESTAEVEELISEIRVATSSTSSATARGSILTEQSTAIGSDVTRALAQVSELARETSNAVRTITMATQQQQTGTDQLAEAMSDILGVTQQGLLATRQLGAANERLHSLSASLGSIMDRFRIVG